MADRYWVGGTASWDGTAGSKWATTSGGTGGEAVPTSSDDVYFDGNSGAVTVTIASGNTGCLSLTCTGFTGTLAGSAAISVSGNIVLVAGMGLTYSGTLSMIATSGTKTITTNTKAFSGSLTFNGSGGTFQLVDGLTLSATSARLSRTAGTFDANSQTITFTGKSGGMGSGSSFTGTSSLYSLTVTGTADRDASFTFFSSATMTNTLTINGNSSINRISVISNSWGTDRTLTAATVSISNADFRDITGAGAGSWDLSAITGLSGDAGGNSGITFTTPVTQYWHVDAGSWSDSAKWFTATNGGGVAGRVPLPQDPVIFDTNSFDNNSQTVTVDMNRLGASVDCSGVTETTVLAFNNSYQHQLLGDFTISASMSTTGNGNAALQFIGRSSASFTANGVTINKDVTMVVQNINIILTFVGGVTVTYDLFSSGGTITSTGDVSAATIGCINSTSGFNLGSYTWTITGSGTSAWTSSSGTITPGTSTIKFTDATATDKTFAGGSKTFNNIWFTGAGTGAFIITGSNTFNDFKVDTPPHTISFTASTTTTVTSFTVSGTVGNLMTIGSVTAASHTLTKTGTGRISSDYLSISRSTATPDFTWYAGANSTDGSNNSGWIFTAPPTTVIKTFNNLTYLSTKTVDNLAVNSVKTFNGLA